MATSNASAIWPKNVRFSRLNPSNGTRNEFAPIKIIKSKRHMKKGEREGKLTETVNPGKYTVTLPLRTEKSDENPSAARYGTCFKYVLRNNVAHAAWLD
jgi:hypothetical protein